METETNINGVIRPEAVYSRKRFMVVTGFKLHAFRMACRAGLKTVKLHNRTFVRGVDAIDYFNRAAAEQHGDAISQPQSTSSSSNG